MLKIYFQKSLTRDNKDILQIRKKKLGKNSDLRKQVCINQDQTTSFLFSNANQMNLIRKYYINEESRAQG